MRPITTPRTTTGVLVTDLQSDEDGPYVKMGEARYPRWDGDRWLHSAAYERNDDD